MTFKQIKWIGCYGCKNRKGCMRKYEGCHVHHGVPEICIVENKFEKEELSNKK